MALYCARQAHANGFIESFNGRLRDELLNETLFSSHNQTRTTLAKWRDDYNQNRPHSQLGWKTPFEHASTFETRRVLALRNIESFTPKPITQNADNELKTG
jgi:putative transposase